MLLFLSMQLPRVINDLEKIKKSENNVGYISICYTTSIYYVNGSLQSRHSDQYIDKENKQLEHR